MGKPLLHLFSLSLAASLLPACSGDIRGGKGQDPNAPYDPNAPIVCDETRAVEAPLKRLTSAQFQNLTRELFGGLVEVEARFPTSPALGSSGFSTDPEANPSSERAVEAQIEAAEEIALGVVGALEALLPCAANDPGEDCAERFIETYAARAMRRPLTSDDRAELLAAYRLGASEGFEDGIATLSAHLFTRPEVIYVIEHGKDGGKGLRELSAYEVATRLSLMLWNSIPDEALWDAAASGALLGDSELEAEARRLLTDERAQIGLGRFVREWAQLAPLDPSTKDESLYPSFDASLARSMEEELSRFAVDVFQNGTIADFYASPETFVDANMAAFYGVAAPTQGWEKRAPEASARLGVMGRPALLASLAYAREGNYIHRGKFVLQQALCQPIPAPPLDALAQNPEFPEGASNREMSEIRRGIQACRSCHERLDGIGLAFDEFGAIGELRSVDSQGNAVDASGTVLASVDVAGEFHGVAELAENLASSEDARACMSAQWFRFAFSRREAGPDLCAVQDVDRAVKDAGGDFESLIVALATTDAFRIRRLIEEK